MSGGSFDAGNFDINDIIGPREKRGGKEGGAGEMPEVGGSPGPSRGPAGGGRGGNQRRAQTAGGGARPRRGRTRLWWILGIAILLVLIIPSLLAEMITDYMWFGSQDLAEVYTTRLWLSLGVLAAAALVAAIFLWVNWSLAWRTLSPAKLYEGQKEPLPQGLGRGIILAAAVILGLFLGLVASGEWSTILLYLNGGQFGQTDPIFNNDVGFYVFEMPFFRLLRGWIFLLLVLTIIGAAVIYALGSLPQITRQVEEVQKSGRTSSINFALDRRAALHLSLLGAVLLLLFAAGYWLDRYDLLYSSRAAAYGAGYTDVNAKLPSLYIMMGVAVAMAVLLLVNLRVRTWKLLAGALGLWLVALVLVGGVYPSFVQNFIVKPSEFQLERSYIENNIAATRRAFGLDKFREREVPALESVTQAQLADNRNTVENIRLWDYRPLLDTYAQLQEIRTYYAFGEVDIDRYNIGGVQKQVMLSARELSSNQLSEQVGTWQNRHFVYTHGYGAVVSPVNEIEGEGLPRLLVKDIPPVTDTPELKITQPRIYYGEQADEYVFVNSTQQEFDYPAGDSNQFTKYDGRGGVEISNFFTKLLFAVRFGDGNVMLTDYITPQTRVLFHRNIHGAIPLLAPFLVYDHDPYLVISEGRLFWMQDAYTISDRYPYATPHPDGFNYIRNSVKVVVDAYHGTASFYVSDPTDPLVQAYRRIFPQLFKDLDQMPAGLRSHIRYPEDLMNWQASMYATFHMTDPQVFFSKEDVWTVPSGSQDDTSEALEAYYVNMQLPGDDKQGFMLILPFTPSGRDNMIAWMAGRSDGEDYGKVDVIRYPKQQLVYGPRQISARINQDPVISQQITLWNASGSSVRRGNLLIVPIGNSVLYVEPLFLQATASRFPELKRVIVATGNSVGIGSNLAEALNVAFKIAPATIVDDGTGAQPSSTPVAGVTPQPASTPRAGSAAELTQSAQRHYDLAQEALQESDWTAYGRELEALKADLDALARLVGVPTAIPSPGVVGTPTP